MIPEHKDPSFRVVQGTAEIRADANLVRPALGWVSLGWRLFWVGWEGLAWLGN